MAVASGIAPLAVATDGGGSTRIPAACNGVVGLKQSNGVIPHSQVQDAFGNQTYVTPMTRTVADTALMMQAMAGRMRPIPGRSEFRALISSAAPRRMGDLSGKKILFLPRAAGPQGFRRCCRGIQDEPENARGARRRTRRDAGRAALTSSRSGARSITPPGGPGLKSSRPSIANELSETFLRQLALAQRSQRRRLPAGDVRPHHPVPAACNRCLQRADLLVDADDIADRAAD